MIYGKVVGNTVVSHKDDELLGKKLLLVQLLDFNNKKLGTPVVAADYLGAGSGEYVCLVQAAEAGFPFEHPDITPSDLTITAIIDKIEMFE